MTAIATSYGTDSVNFTTGDTLTLASDVYVLSTMADAIVLEGTAQSYNLTVDGLIQARMDTFLVGIFVDSTNDADITIGQTGAVRGYAGIYITGDADITNNGTIGATSNAAISYIGTGDTTITNSGLMISGHTGIIFFHDSVGTHTINNSGVISAPVVAIGYGELDDLDSIEIIANTGTITGTIRLAAGNDIVVNDKGTINGTISLDGGDDSFSGGLSAMTIHGGAGADEIRGGTHADLIDGGSDVDTLYGGKGLDVFDFNDVAESGLKAGKRDIIDDFKRGQDHIDLSTIDARFGGDDNAFVLLGKDSASSAVGTGKIGFYWEDNSGKDNDRTILRINNDSDAKIEMTIEISGLHKLDAGDFIL